MTVKALLHHPAFLWGTRIIVALALGLLIWGGVRERWIDALFWAAIAAVAVAALAGRDKLPIMLGFLLALAAAVNGAGYAFNMWHEKTSFDEAMHVFTPFALMAAIGWAMCGSRKVQSWSRPALFAAVVGVGLVIGVIWEGFEMLIGISGSQKDTLIDLAMDTIGSAAAAALTCWFQSSRHGNDGELSWKQPSRSMT